MAYGGSSFLNDAISFRHVIAYAINGGTNSATLNDSSGNDTFTGSGNTGTLTLGTTPSESETVNGFSNVNIVSSQGGLDTATIGSIFYQLSKTGPRWR
jgi:hypothetical protein